MTPRAPLCHCLAALATAYLLASSTARADAEGDAKDLFARGRELRANGNCAEAVVAFSKALAVYPAGLGSLRNLAECEEELHRYASSRRDWLDLKRALVGSTDAKYQTWSGDAQAAAARLAPLVARLTVQVIALRNDRPVPSSERPSFTVRINDETLPLALLGTELERDPGPYVVRVIAASGGATALQSVHLGEGESRRVTLRFTQRDAPPAAAAAPPGTGDPNAGRRLAGWVTLGVGMASLVGAGVSLAVRQTAQADVDAACPGHTECARSLQPTVDRGHLATALTNVLGALGIVATGAGAALVLTSPAQSPRSGVTFRPMVGSAPGLAAEWILP